MNPPATEPAEGFDPLPDPAGPPFTEYLLAVATVTIPTVICELGRDYFGMADDAMLYLACLLFIASRFSRGPTFVAGLFSIAALDFFYVPPYFAMSVADIRYGLTFGVMLVTGFFVSTLTLRIRQQGEIARQRERRTAVLYGMTRSLAARSTVSDIAEAVAQHIGLLFETSVSVLFPDSKGELVRRGGKDEPSQWNEREREAARLSISYGSPAGSGTAILPDTGGLYIPLKSAMGTFGTVAVALGSRRTALAPAQRQLLEVLVAQSSLALERALFSEQAEKAQVVAETERLRSSLLSAISHDLRTPLGVVTGAATSLLEQGGKFDPATQRDFIETIRDEAIRLNGFVDNLLEITRLESGAFTAKKVWYPVEDLIGSALRRLQGRLVGRKVDVRPTDSLLVAPLDPVLMEQVIINLLENALKYTPAGSPVELSARPSDGQVIIELADRGPGIPPGEQEKIFEKFYRLSGARDPGGTGLGLAVCRAILRAHGGTISARNREGGGTVFSVSLPLDGAPPPLPED